MGDLIDRNKLYNYIKAQINPYGKPFTGSVREFGEKLMDYLLDMETVDAVPVEEIKNLENPYSTFKECYKCEFDGFETARRHLILKYEEKVQE